MLASALGEDLVGSFAYKENQPQGANSAKVHSTCSPSENDSQNTARGYHSHSKSDLSVCDVNYPLTLTGRQSFRTRDGRRVTAHQWAVYDFTRRIPAGRVTTYKDVCTALGEGSPRSVGNALRNNPFAPFVPCHRVVASNFFVGGFYGEWGTTSGTGTQCRRKMDMLGMEGVLLTKNGYLLDPQESVWRPDKE